MNSSISIIEKRLVSSLDKAKRGIREYRVAYVIWRCLLWLRPRQAQKRYMYVCMLVCLYACVYVCMHVYMNACMHACSSMHECMYACMYACKYACVQQYACMQQYAGMQACRHAGMQVCMYACMHVCMYAALCMHACSVWHMAWPRATLHGTMSRTTNLPTTIYPINIYSRCLGSLPLWNKVLTRG